MAFLGAVGYGVRQLLVLLIILAQALVLAYACLRAYRIRMHAVNTYGYIIHEFDPWFNYRATEYLAAHGASKFFKWYDYMSWYPLGRPVGTTIFPGMQLASVAIWELMKYIPAVKYATPKEMLAYLPKYALAYLPNDGKFLAFGPMSLNDVCVMVPAWFGSLATILTFLWAAEMSGSNSAGVVAACIMAIIPAHIMRSSAGEFDNECVAVSCFCLVLWLWCRALRAKWTVPVSFLAGLAYAFAASAWGGYIFINNLIGLHAAVLVALGKYNSSVYKTYTVFFIVGTLGAMQVPVIGYAPLRSVEQAPSLLVFCGFQVLQLCDIYRGRQSKGMSATKFFLFRFVVFTFIAGVVAGVAWSLMQLGFFIPLGARIRGLFLEAVKTGNPLVDSVAEHQPSNDQAYDTYLGKVRFLAALGLLFSWHQRSNAKYLGIIYALVSFHYSLKMSRLMIICGPIVSVLAGFPVGIIADWCLTQALNLVYKRVAPEEEEAPLRAGGMGSILRSVWHVGGGTVLPSEFSDVVGLKDRFASKVPWVDRPVRLGIAVAIVYLGHQELKAPAKEFVEHCDMIAKHMGSPQIAFETRLNNGQMTIIDDYLKGYLWMKENTPKDARVMAWWDYGYQITGIAERTSLADGNTWNHEHIATLGRILTSNEAKSHKAMRHMADYVLVWAGGQGDDMAKSPHLARIGNSVFPDHCGDEDPLCHKFSFYADGEPTPMMAKSFLYKAVNHDLVPGVKLNPKYWKEVHKTKYGLMRIFKVMNVSEESKAWVANKANLVCDAPGSWYCVGQYPPALKPLIAKRRNFNQLEDFNKGLSREKSAYTKLIEAERQSGSGKQDEL